MDKKPLSEKYEVGLMIASLIVVGIMVIGLTVFPEQGVAISHAIMHLLTHTFGSAMQLIALGIFFALVILALSKYGNIRLGNSKPEYPVVSWVAMIFFFGIMGGYQMNLREQGVLDVPGMLADGRAEEIALSTMHTLPLSKIAMCVYLFVIVLFLATTMDAISQTLSTTIAKKLDEKGEAPKPLKFAWCLILCALPIAIYFVGTDIDTIKSIVLLTGFPLVIIIAIIYKGILREMFSDFGRMTKEEIIEAGALPEEKK